MLKHSDISLKSNVVSKNLSRNGERGNATAKFLGVVILLFVVGYGGYNYVVTWYQCSHFKEKMTEIITQAYALPNNKSLNSIEGVYTKIREIGYYDNVPEDAVITVERQKTGLVARAVFTREVNLLPFNMFKYKYQFDHTAKPPSLFEIK